MQIHKGHDQDIFGLMGKDSKIRVRQTLNLRPAGLSTAFGAWKRRVGTDVSVVYGELWNPYKSYVFITDNIFVAMQYWMLHLQ